MVKSSAVPRKLLSPQNSNFSSKKDDKMLTAEKIPKKKSAMKKKTINIDESTPTKTDILRHSRLLESLMMSPTGALSARKYELKSERKVNGAQEDLVRCKQQSQIV